MNKTDSHDMTYVTDLMNKIVHVSDLVTICQDVYCKITSRLNRTQSIDDKRARIQDTGRLVWIADRFVDIDFSKLKDAIPYVVDGDRLMIIRDETRNDQCSVYSIYNTDSVPNIKYLGYEDPNIYPSCTAVQQYVSHSVAMSERGLVNAINDLRSDTKLKIEELTRENEHLKELLDGMNQMLSNLTDEVQSIHGKIDSLDKRILSNEDDIKKNKTSIDANTASIQDNASSIISIIDKIESNTTAIAEESTRATQAETSIRTDVSQHSLRLDKCESDIEELKKPE